MSWAPEKTMTAEITRETIVEAARKAATEAGSVISRTDFERLTGISQYHIYRAFPEGGWSEVRRLAGIGRHPKDNQPLSDDTLLNEFHRVATELGKIPTWSGFAAHATISADVIRRRFGGLSGTIAKYKDWLETHEPDSLILKSIQDQITHESYSPALVDIPIQKATLEWNKKAGVEFGSPINFRGLRHAPINEQGVVFLFGAVSYELGFIVEAVHASYPDCEAKRCIDRRRDRWQRVRIEFEYRSSHFLDHGHDPKQCDIIVCWEHNWPDCPLEVLELRRVINELEE